VYVYIYCCVPDQQSLAHTLTHSRRTRANKERQSVIESQNFIANGHKNKLDKAPNVVLSNQSNVKLFPSLHMLFTLP